MADYPYLIIGGGMTADAAVRGIRKLDPRSTIGLISAEAHQPYDRPPLTKGLWKGKPLEKIWRQTEKLGNVEIHLRRKVTALDPQAKKVSDEQGNTYNYEKLLLATGGTPRRLPFGGDRIRYYRTLDDYRSLREQIEKGYRFTVIGGGFIGSEIAAALAMNDEDVVIVFPETGIGARMFPRELSKFLNRYYEEKGVTVLSGEMLTDTRLHGDRVTLETEKGRQIQAEAVIAGIGLRPNTELAEAAGLKLENGVAVDEFLRTSQPDIYAAGDVASFHNPALNRRMRVEHEDNANTMGQLAGQNMAATRLGEQPSAYDHLPFFYSDLFDLGYEAVGDLNSDLETVEDWQEPFQKGVVYYLKGGQVRGVLLWNVWGKVEAARRLIAEPGPFKASDLKDRLTKE